MRKKVMLAVVSLLVIALASISLTGCFAKNPADFLKKFGESDKMAVALLDSDGNYSTISAITKDKMYVKIDKSETYTIKADNGIEVYTKLGDEWKYELIEMSTDEIDAKWEEAKKNLEENEIITDVDVDKFEEDFTKDDEGWWKLNDSIGILKMKVEGGKLTIKTSLIGDLELNVVLMTNYNINLPSEAKAAKK